MITFGNYHLNTKAYWKAVTCEPEDFKCSDDNTAQGGPEVFYKGRKADYVSFNREGYISSAYWYCHDKNGKPYILRFSNHWMIQSSKEIKIRNKVTGVASCRWYLKAVRDPILVHLSVKNSNYYGGGNGHLGKCYLDSFSKR